MFSLKNTFAKAAFGTPGSDTFWLLIWTIFILDEAQRRKEERRKKRQRAADNAEERRTRKKPPCGPRPV